MWLKFTHISPLGYGLHEFSLGFNTVANVYPNAILNDLSLFMREYALEFVLKGVSDMYKFEPKDLLLKKFKKKYNLKEFILEPSVFQHVGLQSSFSFANVLNTENNNIYKVQFRPFQSYSFLKEYTRPLTFDPVYWLEK